MFATATTATLPGDRAWDPERIYGDLVWIAFVLVQAADGMLTYVGIHAFGLVAEANPLIAWYALEYGIAAAIVGAKLFATLCGALLHASERHQVLALLTLAHCVVAIWPWSQLLFP
jgi:hypothetical protein